jgi:hypothetical protein
LSRGLGVRQRAILDRLDQEPWVFVWELLTEEFTQAERFAYRRAAHQLQRLGLVELTCVSLSSFGMRMGRDVTGYLLVKRLGVTPNDGEVGQRYHLCPQRTWV